MPILVSLVEYLSAIGGARPSVEIGRRMISDMTLIFVLYIGRSEPSTGSKRCHMMVQCVISCGPIQMVYLSYYTSPRLLLPLHSTQDSR